MLKKSITILAYVVILRAVPETVRVLVVVGESDDRSPRQFFGAEPW
jgi:hypothetical protein